MNYPISSLDQLGLILKGFRKQKGMTQANLARQLSVTQQAIAKLEASPEKASVEHLFRVLRLLDATLVLADAAPAAKQPTQFMGGEGIPGDYTIDAATKHTLTAPATRSVPAKKKPARQIIQPQGADSLKMGSQTRIQAPRAVIKKRESW